MLAKTLSPSATEQATAALALRSGLGLVLVSGGIAKLERLLTRTTSKGIVDQYVGLLRTVLTPWSFLPVLSAFELIAGIILIAGLMIRPLALIWAFL